MNFTNKEPIFIQIANYYEKLIKVGVFPYDSSLPSVREVALEYLVNPNTVQRAFTKLVEDHLILNIPKKGYFVCYKANQDSSKHLEEQLNELLHSGYSIEDIQLALDRIKGESHHD